MADLQAVGSQLDGALKVLSGRWIQTRTVWTDAVGQGFEREFWVPLESVTRSTHQTMGPLAAVIAQARRSVK